MITQFFTFGFGHVHPASGESLTTTVARIDAQDRSEARRRMLATFGTKWAFQYDSAEEAGVDDFGLRVVPIEELEGWS